MKKKLLPILLLCGLGLTTFITSCRKTLDCIVEGSFTSITATVDAANVKQYTFVPDYYGSHTVNTVEWDFGDGQQATTSGTASVTHIYSAAGTYTVKASVIVKDKSRTCTAKPEETVQVQ